MTPKEKAKELGEKFYKCMPFKDSKLTSCDEKLELIEEMEKLSAKQCIIILVNEILSDYKRFSLTSWVTDEYMINYWRKVKTEIEKL